MYRELPVFPKEEIHVIKYIVERESVNAESGRGGGIITDIVNKAVANGRKDNGRIERTWRKRGNKCDMPRPHGVKIFR